MTTVTLGAVLAHAERLWPAAGAETWDEVGLVCGSRDQTVSRVLFVVDVTNDTISEAIDGGFDLIVAHHPLLLRGVTTVADDRFKGHALTRLIRAGIALLSVHTNGDRVTTGTSMTLAHKLGLTNAQPIVANALGGGIGAHGSVTPTTLGAFAKLVASVLPPTAGGVKVAGAISHTVSTVALCAGAGDSLLGEATVLSADVYVTSDLRHHPASEFRDNAVRANNTALIDISHWAAEWLWLDGAAAELAAAVPGLDVVLSDLNTDPWTFSVMQ